MIRPALAKLHAFAFKGTLRRRISVSLIIFATVLLASVMLTYSKTGETYRYKIGDIAKKHIRVPWDITYVKETETQLEKKRARDNEPLLFDLNRYVMLDYIQNINTLFNDIDRLYESGMIAESADMSVISTILKESLPEYMQYDTRVFAAIVSTKNRNELRKTIVRILNDVYSPGILETPYSNTLQIPNSTVIARSINDIGEYIEEHRTLESIETLESVQKKLPTICDTHYSVYPENVRKAVFTIISSMLVQNMQFNSDETLKRINLAADSLQPIMGTLKKDQVIVREGDSITTESYNLIRVMNNYTSTLNLNYTLGAFLIQAVFFLIIAYFIRDNYTRIFPDINAFIITFMLLNFFFIYTYFTQRTVAYSEKGLLFPLYLPLSAVLVIITILYNIRLSLIVSLYMFLYVMIISGGDYAITSIFIASSFIGIYGTKGLERRIDFLVCGFAIGLTNVIIIAAITLLKKMPSEQFISNFELALVSGIVNMIIAMGLFPFFEYLFKLTTRFKLLELADLNAPIFKEMLLKAPGTYNHSIMVANMAEAACKEIHADALLARVGSYFHDIGKLESPAIYIENKKEDSTINLSPEEYSRKIINHVYFGVSLARENNLPETVIDFIREHHGKSVMSYFYHQALSVAQKSRKSQSVHPSNFSYPGPNPNSKETTVVMLADSLEAAARSVKDPTVDKLDSLVKKIIRSKMSDGALVSSPLTMNELTIIEKAFVNVLAGIYHTRIEYPERSAISSLEKKVKEIQNKNRKTKDGAAIKKKLQSTIKSISKMGKAKENTQTGSDKKKRPDRKTDNKKKR